VFHADVAALPAADHAGPDAALKAVEPAAQRAMAEEFGREREDSAASGARPADDVGCCIGCCLVHRGLLFLENGHLIQFN